MILAPSLHAISPIPQPATNFRGPAVYLGVGTEDEADLIRRCLDGEADAFEPLVERYHRPLFRAAVRLLGDREEARDATQTAFLKAYKGLPSCDPRRRFFSWIYRILVNDCLNVLRARHPTEPLDEDAPYGFELSSIEAGETQRRVRAAIRRTPMASVMVSTAGKPSGIAATAMPTTAMKASSTL